MPLVARSFDGRCVGVFRSLFVLRLSSIFAAPRSLDVRILTMTLTFCLGMPATGSAQRDTRSSTPTQRSMGSRKNYVGLPNFGEVTPHLYRRGQPGADGLKALKKMGVGIVVDMRGSKSTHERAAVEKLGMEYVSIPWHCPFPRDKAFARFLRLMKENPKKKVFVHCRLGDDRTGMAVAAYRMGIEGWSADEALKEMKLFGYSGLHHAICPGLGRFEKNFPKHLEKNPDFKDIRPAQPEK
jgi:tyrosine-protein phosphatase SIW14